MAILNTLRGAPKIAHQHKPHVHISPPQPLPPQQKNNPLGLRCTSITTIPCSTRLHPLQGTPPLTLNKAPMPILATHFLAPPPVGFMAIVAIVHQSTPGCKLSFVVYPLPTYRSSAISYLR